VSHAVNAAHAIAIAPSTTKEIRYVPVLSFSMPISAGPKKAEPSTAGL